METTVQIDGAVFQATEKMQTRFAPMGARLLAKMIAEKQERGVTFWRELPKDSLIVVAAHLFATDAERIPEVEEPEAPSKWPEGKVILVSKTPPVNEARPLGTPRDVQEMNEGTSIDGYADALRQATGAVQVTVTDGDKVGVSPKAPKAKPEPKPAQFFMLRCTLTPEPKWLRRDQPRKPGETATYKAVEFAKATRYTSKHQAELKLAEVAALYDDVEHIVELDVRDK